MNATPDYTVPEEDLRRRWEASIRPDLFQDVRRQRDPMLLLVGGQTGAGKSSVRPVIRDDLRREFVEIDFDDLRWRHPRIDAIIRDNPERMMQHTQQAATVWRDLAVKHARTNGYDVLIEKTFQSPDLVVAEAHDFKEAGYTVVAAAMGVPARDSHLSIVDRYVDARENGRPARWTELDMHDKGFHGTPQTLEALAVRGDVDRFLVLTRDSGVPIYDSDRPHNADRSPAVAVNSARAAVPSPEQRLAWQHRYEDVVRRAAALHLTDKPVCQPVFEALKHDADELRKPEVTSQVQSDQEPDVLDPYDVDGPSVDDLDGPDPDDDISL